MINPSPAIKMNHFSLDDFKNLADLGSIFSIIASFFDKMPHLAAIVAALWVFLRVYDYIRYVRPNLMKKKSKGFEDDAE